ncbi:MAG: Rrf2 family transcriptional regulator [Fimbriiglobus sp.]|jgi:Rrf2 family protein|nr:Rrf2 family transcriptional regulator [Fimbriiglobus sp.]
MPVTAKAEYACLAMLELATRYTEARPVRLAEVTDKHGIDHGFLVQILLELRNAGLVVTARGKSGGYRLAKAPHEITLADIVEVLDGVGKPKGRGGTTPTSSLGHKLQRVWAELSVRLADTQTGYLTGFTLADLLAYDATPDYMI